jgi:hypothetical protein
VGRVSGGALCVCTAAFIGCGDDSPAGRSPTPDAGVPEDAAPDAHVEAEAAPSSCDFEAQDCSDTAAKCSIVQRDTGGYASVCVPARGQRRPGEACQRTSVGYDDCEARSLCSSVATTASDTTVCRTLCDETAQCDASERCYRFSLGQSEVYGMCVPECRFFETDCGAGRHCLLVTDTEDAPFAICDAHGTVEEGEPCANAENCGSGMACARLDGVGSCRSYCDPAHPCESPFRSCSPLGFLELPGLGVCLPS